METIKISPNTEFDVLYEDGTRHHVTEGVLFEVEDGGRIVFHNGTNRANVLFASVEALFEVIGLLGLTEMLEAYLDSNPEAETPDNEGGADNGV